MTPEPQNIESIFGNVILTLPRLATALLIFVGALMLASFVARLIERWAGKRGLEPSVGRLLGRLGRFTVIAFGTIWALEQINFNVGAFVLALGIVGFTIGFALQDISKNFVAGLLLLLQRPFQIGDAIEVKGYTGTVHEISLRATVIKTFDGLRVYIPNADVYASPLTNFSQATQRRIGLRVGVAYDTDLEQATRVALQAIRDVPELALEDPPSQVVFDNFGDSSIDFTLYYWIDTTQSKFLDAKDQGVRAIKRAFQEQGIEIPFPIREVLLSQQGA
jgi:small conductance mechanosensitive channel